MATGSEIIVGRKVVSIIDTIIMAAFALLILGLGMVR